LRRAELLRRAGHPADAAADLRVVARLDPDNRPLKLERALVAIDRGQRRAARRDLDAFLATGDGTVLAHATRAQLRQHAGELADARADYDAALAIGPTPELYLQRADVDEADDDLDAASRGLAEGCAGTTSPPVVLLLRRLDVERRRERFDLALEVVDTMLRGAPHRAEWILERAEVLSALGRDGEALGERLRALALANAALARRGSANHRLARARVYLALGRPADALPDLRWVVAHAPALTEAPALLRRAEESKR
jgi:tetratricopeptide (TPR) repeat protein